MCMWTLGWRLACEEKRSLRMAGQPPEAHQHTNSMCTAREERHLVCKHIVLRNTRKTRCAFSFLAELCVRKRGGRSLLDGGSDAEKREARREKREARSEKREERSEQRAESREKREERNAQGVLAWRGSSKAEESPQW
eukprot:2765934-Rhodomonas_salina.1